MFQSTFQDVGDDLHVPVTVHPESLARLYSVLVDDPQRTETHVSRVVVGVEGKRVPGIEPVVPGMACKRRSKNVAQDGACVTVEKRGALEPTRGRVSKACDGITVYKSYPSAR